MKEILSQNAVEDNSGGCCFLLGKCTTQQSFFILACMLQAHSCYQHKLLGAFMVEATTEYYE